jgi:hypothetical protein
MLPLVKFVKIMLNYHKIDNRPHKVIPEIIKYSKRTLNPVWLKKVN